MSDGIARTLSLYFAAGAIGGLANSLVVFGFDELRVDAALGVAIRAPMTTAWLYPRIVWGGLWGLAFALPLATQSWVRRGLWLSLLPSLVQLLAIFPLRQHVGLLGLELGALTPVLVLFYNACGGLTASWWIRATRA